MAVLAATVGSLLLWGCGGGPYVRNLHSIRHMSVLVLPFKNLTNTPEAGKSITALFISSITIHRTFYLASAGSATVKTLAGIDQTGSFPNNILETLAKEHIDAILFGNVTEYEYRTGLSTTEPIVGFTWKMVSTRTGRTMWAGAVSRLDSCFWFCHDTLSEFGKRLVDSEVRRLS